MTKKRYSAFTEVKVRVYVYTDAKNPEEAVTKLNNGEFEVDFSTAEIADWDTMSKVVEES